MWGLDWITPDVCFCGRDVETGDINEFWKATHRVERGMGTPRLPNMTSISIRRPPTHEKAARATFFPYGFGGPEQLFSRTARIHIYPQNTTTNTRFGDRFCVLFGPILGYCFGQGLSSVCVCLRVGVRYNRLMGRLAGRTRPHDPPAHSTLPHNVG